MSERPLLALKQDQQRALIRVADCRFYLSFAHVRRVGVGGFSYNAHRQSNTLPSTGRQMFLGPKAGFVGHFAGARYPIT